MQKKTGNAPPEKKWGVSPAGEFPPWRRSTMGGGVPTGPRGAAGGGGEAGGEAVGAGGGVEGLPQPPTGVPRWVRGPPARSLFARAGGGAGLGRRTCRRYRRSLQMRCGCGEESGRGTAPYPSTAAGFRRSGRATFGGIACVVDGTKTRSARGLCGRRRPFARRAGCLCARIASSTGTGANGCRRAGNPATEATARTRASRWHELNKKKNALSTFRRGASVDIEKP